MKYYVIEVTTDIDMGSPRFVRSLLTEWSLHPNKKLRPDRFGSTEPARRKLSEEGIEPAIDMWLRTGMTPVLKRVARPKFECSFDWHRVAGVGRVGKIPWKCTVRIDSEIEDDLLIQLLEFLVRLFRPAFGSIASDDERIAKHKIRYRAYGGIAEKFVGLDVGAKLPGIYWITYFGPWCIERLGGRHRILRLPARVFDVGPGIAVMAFRFAADWRTANSRETVNAILTALGPDQFFDKESVCGNEANDAGRQ